MPGRAEVAVGLELVAFNYIGIRPRRGDWRDIFQIFVLSDVVQDVVQHLATIHFAQVQVQQHGSRARGTNVRPLVAEKSRRLHNVASDVHADEGIDVAEGFPRKPQIAGTVFNPENL